MRIRVGTDVGGTFTDLWARTDDGREVVVKSPSTSDIVGGILGAIDLAAVELSMTPEAFCASIDRFGHGTTAGLNALLTQTTPRTAIVTTEGFGDTLAIGRLQRQLVGLTDLELGDYLNRGRWPVLVERPLIFEARERIDAHGEVVTALTHSEIERVVGLVDAADVRAVAVCTLWSVANPTHENALAAAIRDRLPEIFVSVSHRISPTVGEYARMATTAVNAALAPVMTEYLARLDFALAARGVSCPVMVMTGEGGVVNADEVSDEPVSVLMSGPSAGVIACRDVARGLGYTHVLTVDIGGTSFDVGTIVDGEALLRTEFSIGGSDIQRPSIDVSTIGAGGGSIARVRAGSLTVGPASAGARPGPVCYGRGGEEPTATDADLVLGVLAEEDFAGGTMTLDRDAAARAIRTHVAEPLGLSVIDAARGIRDILDSRMADLLRSVTIERGHDPRDFVVFAGGGQGPSHAWALCRELGVREFVVTPVATGQSAFGTGTSEVTRTLVRPAYVRFDGSHGVVAGDIDHLMKVAGELRDVVSRTLDQVAALTTTLAIRYRGQAHHLDIELREDLAEPASAAVFFDRFEQRYEALFGAGSGFRKAGMEITSVRVVGAAQGTGIPPAAHANQLEADGERDVYFDGPEPVPCPVFRCDFPAPDQQVSGPSLIVSSGQTLVVPPGASVRTDHSGNFIVTFSEEAMP